MLSTGRISMTAGQRRVAPAAPRPFAAARAVAPASSRRRRPLRVAAEFKEAEPTAAPAQETLPTLKDAKPVRARRSAGKHVAFLRAPN
jgi:hypothetical protein